MENMTKRKIFLKCSNAHSVGGALLLDAAELELVLGSSAIPPPSRNMVTAISRLLLHASSMCFPTLSVAPRSDGHKFTDY